MAHVYEGTPEQLIKQFSKLSKTRKIQGDGYFRGTGGD